MEYNANEEIEIDLWDLLNLIKTRLWIIILSAAIACLSVGLYSYYMITPIYSSKTQLYIMSRSTSITSLADIQIGTQLTQDYMVLVKSRPVVNQVIENLYMNSSYEEMVSRVSVSNPSNTRILEIKIDYPNAYLAKRIADEFSTVSTEYIANIMATEKPSIVDEGNLPTRPSSPSVMKNAIIGAMLGGMLATGIVFVLYMMDDTIKDKNDIEKHLGLSTLGLIPIESGKANKVKIDKIKRMNKREDFMKFKKGKKVG